MLPFGNVFPGKCAENETVAGRIGPVIVAWGRCPEGRQAQPVRLVGLSRLFGLSPMVSQPCSVCRDECPSRRDITFIDRPLGLWPIGGVFLFLSLSGPSGEFL